MVTASCSRTLRQASWLLLWLNLIKVTESPVFITQTCCHLIIQFVLIGRSPFSFGHWPRQSYSPKIVGAVGPLRLVVEKKKKILTFFFFFWEDSPDNKQSPEAEWKCKRSDLHNVLNNWADIGAFRWHGTHMPSVSFFLCSYFASLHL